MAPRSSTGSPEMVSSSCPRSPFLLGLGQQGTGRSRLGPRPANLQAGNSPRQVDQG